MNHGMTLMPDAVHLNGDLIEIPWSSPAWLVGLAVTAFVFFLLAFDGRLHWDEPSYLYIGAFLSLDAIMAGDFQPSGIEGHYLSRLLHVLLVHAITQLTGPGIEALIAVISIYLVLLLAFAWLSLLILAELMPGAPRLGRAVLLTAFTPIYLYLAFKTLPETPALFLSALATLALLRSLRDKALLWIGISACALAAVAFFKNNMALLWVSFVGALLIAPPIELSRVKLLGHVLLAGVGALVLSSGVLLLADIELAQYLGVGANLLERDDPPVLAVLNFLLEGGVFLLALPLAFLSGQKRRIWFFAAWFVLATAPLFLVFDYIESRYLATNLIALTGLIWLAAEALRPAAIDWWRRRRTASLCLGGASVLAVLGSNGLALAIMAHEVRMDHLHDVVERLDRAYGRDYAILASYTYTDFHYLRFAYPDHHVYSVQSFENGSSAVSLRQPGANDYNRRAIQTIDELAALDTKLVYVGFEENFSVANLRAIVSFVPFLGLERNFEQINLLDHLTLSWMWRNPNVILTERFRRGHYQVYDVELRAGALDGTAEPPG